jgi:hypothetical protein
VLSLLHQATPMLRSCYPVQAIPMLGAVFTTGCTMFIALDRLSAVTFYR